MRPDIPLRGALIYFENVHDSQTCRPVIGFQFEYGHWHFFARRVFVDSCSTFHSWEAERVFWLRLSHSSSGQGNSSWASAYCAFRITHHYVLQDTLLFLKENLSISFLCLRVAFQTCPTKMSQNLVQNTKREDSPTMALLCTHLVEIVKNLQCLFWLRFGVVHERTERVCPDWM